MAKKFTKLLKFNRRKNKINDNQVDVRAIFEQMDAADTSGGSATQAKAAEISGRINQVSTEVKRFSERYRIMLLTAFAVFVAATVGMIGIFNHYMAYEYSYNGKVLGVVKDKEDVLKITDLIQSALTEEQDMEVVIDKKDDITFKRVSAMGGDVHIDTSEEVLKRMTYVGDINVKAYSITVNGRRAAVVDSEESAHKVLTSIKEEYTNKGDNVVVENAKFVEDIQIKEVNTGLDNLQKEDDAKEALKTGAVVETSHIIMAGETLADLASAYNMSEEEILTMNPGIDPRKLEVGGEIKLKEEKPVITYETSELITYEEPVKYETVEKKTDNLYEGETKVKTKGKDGTKVITARVEKSNGKESTKTPIVEKVEKEPVQEVVLVGTKERPPTIGSGEYIYPVDNYRLSSPFGARWGRNHNGVDLACPMKTDVHAADGGTVTFAGYKGSFGYLVIIDHQNGMETYYAHNSELLVKEGDKVYQGYHIAESGSTGRSTGPHCHFEIRVNGKPTDPLKYLP